MRSRIAIAFTTAALIASTGLHGSARADQSVSGLELIELAHDEYGLQYEFGHGGRAVCELANVPEDAPEECLRGGEPFWGYWRGDGNGGWTWSGTGAYDSEVEHGDIDGWAWGEGFDGSSHPKPGREGERITFESVCREDDDVGPSGRAALVVDTGADIYRMCVNLPFEAPSDKPSESPPADGEDDRDRSGESKQEDERVRGKPPDVEPSPIAPTGPDHRMNSAPEVSELRALAAAEPPSPTPSPSGLPESATSADEDDDFPVGGLLALAVVTAMAAGVAFFVLKRRAG